MGTLAIAGSITGSGAGGVEGYSPNAWLLDGANDFLLRSNTIAPHTEHEGLTFTCGFKSATGASGSREFIYAQNDFRFSVELDANDKIKVFGREIGGTTTIDLVSTAAVSRTDETHALAFSADLSTASPVFTMVLDGSVIATTDTTLAQGKVDFQASAHAIGALADNTLNFDGCLWNVGLDHGDAGDGYVDLTVPANRNAIMSGNNMKDPGSDGSDYFGRQPIVMMQSASPNAGDNDGTGGDFVEQSGPFRCLRVGVDIGVPPLYVSVLIYEATYAENSTLVNWSNAAEAEGEVIGYYLDDEDQLSGTAITNLNTFIASGHYVGMGPTGGDALWQGGVIPNGPVEIQYDGADNNPVLTISNSGITWALTTDEGNDDITYADVSSGTGNEYLQFGLLATIDLLANWSAQINPVYSSAFDDAYSESVAPGTFALSGSPPKTTDPVFDQVRRKELEIDAARTTMVGQGITSLSNVFYSPSWSSADTALEPWLRDDSIYPWTGLFGYAVGSLNDDSDAMIVDGSPISDIDGWQVNDGIGREAQLSSDYFKGNIATYDAMSAADKEHQIRLNAKGLSCKAGKTSAYLPIMIPHDASLSWTPEEMGWIINELKIQKVQFLTMDEAILRFDQNIPDNTLRETDTGIRLVETTTGTYLVETA